MLRDARDFYLAEAVEAANLEHGLPRQVAYTRLELRQAFEAVQADSHWKDPIRATIRPEMLPLVAAAVVHYTATELVVEKYDRASGLLTVRADGYRAGPAGDH